MKKTITQHYNSTAGFSTFLFTPPREEAAVIVDGTHPNLANGSGDSVGIQRYWLDVALHEVVHQYCHETLGKPERAEKGHGLTFARECSRIGAQLDLPPVGPARKSRNKENLPSCAYWPTNVRQPTTEAYFCGAYRPDLAPRRGAATTAFATPEIEHDEAEPSIGTGQSINPLTPEEWSHLFAITATVVEARPLITRLARHHHSMPVIAAVPTLPSFLCDDME